MNVKPGNIGSLSVVIPARNEAPGLKGVLSRVRSLFPEAQIVVVNDGSTDNTLEVCMQYDITIVNHPHGIGNGAAIKNGARVATGDIIVFMDGDGQHDPNDIPRLLEALSERYDMVVGARVDGSHAGMHRAFANGLYNKLASWMTGQRIEDLTSGFRAVRAEKFRKFLYLLPNGFSYPTTITMSFFRAGYPVAYVPIQAAARHGKSHIRPVMDGVRFFLIIFKIGTLYSPLKLFLPISIFNFFLGVGYYFYTFINFGRFTNMSALLFISALLIFLIGLVSEQITMLVYKETSDK